MTTRSCGPSADYSTKATTNVTAKLSLPCLYDALCQEGQKGGSNEGSKHDAKRYTQEIDIYQYEMIMLSIWIDKHGTSVAVDMITKQIRYLDTVYEGGSEVLLKIKRWLRGQWVRFHTDPPPEWNTLPSTYGTTPRQRDDNGCGV